ncbi:MAG: HEAT repeat domain-containing protein [Pseudomonadota bacterium]
MRPPFPALAVSAQLFLAGGALVATLRPAPAQAAQDVRIEDVEESLARDPSFKVRVDAALILGRLGQRRSVPALAGALRDPDGGVRAAAADALGAIATRPGNATGPQGDALPRDALAGALRDPEPSVRRAARAALHRIGDDESQPAIPGEPVIRRHRSETSFEVKTIADPGHRAGPVLQSHMRDFLAAQLRTAGEVDPGDRTGTYAVDGVIQNLSMTATPRDVEVTCAVQLVISRQPQGGVFMLTTGQATVQKPKRQWRPQLRPGMELEALEAAVRSASEDLVTHLARR